MLRVGGKKRQGVGGRVVALNTINAMNTKNSKNAINAINAINSINPINAINAHNAITNKPHLISSGENF